MTTDQITPDQPDRSDEEPTAASAGTDRPFGFWLKVVDRRLSEEMETLFAADKTNAFELTAEKWLQRPWYVKLSERVLEPLRYLV